MKCNQSRSEFELVSPCPFPTRITITPRAPKVSSCPDYIFEIHHLWQSGFSRVYSSSICSSSVESEIIKICQSSHKIYSNNILNVQESTRILNTYAKKSGNLFHGPYKRKNWRENVIYIQQVMFVLWEYSFFVIIPWSTQAQSSSVSKGFIYRSNRTLLSFTILETI